MLWKPFNSNQLLPQVKYIHGLSHTQINDFVLGTSEQIGSNNDDENAADNDVSSSLADMPSSSTDSPRLGNLGDWEKHTRVRNMKIDLIR